MPEFVDQEARDKGNDTAHSLRNHITVTDYRLGTIEKKIDDNHDDLKKAQDRLESILKWAGGLILMLFLSTLTWSLTQQYNANEQAKKDLEQQIEMLKEQERARNNTRAEILSRLPEPSATESADPAHRRP